jgi:hypothetical protein
MHTLRSVEESDIWAKFSAFARAGLKTEIKGLTSVHHRIGKGNQLTYSLTGWLCVSFFLWTDPLCIS